VAYASIFHSFVDGIRHLNFVNQLMPKHIYPFRGSAMKSRHVSPAVFGGFPLTELPSLKIGVAASIWMFGALVGFVAAVLLNAWVMQ
jgi:hypothetical protein